MQKRNWFSGVSLIGKCLVLLLVAFAVTFAVTACGNDDDDDGGGSGSHGLRKKIVGVWVIECVKKTQVKTKILAAPRKANASKPFHKWDDGTELTFHDDGTYEDSSDGGFHKWDVVGDDELELDGEQGFEYEDDPANGGGTMEYTDEEYTYIWCWRKKYTPEPGEEHCVECEFPGDVDPEIPIYPGNEPPYIEGCYLMQPMKIVYSTVPKDKIGQIVDGGDYIRFTNQNARRNTLDFQSNTVEDGYSYGQESGSGVYITGKGNNFTVFFKQNSANLGNGVTGTTLAVYSGTKTRKGISNLYYMTMVLSKQGDSNNKMPVGSYRIFKDNDGLSEIALWRNWPRRAKSLTWSRFLTEY